MNAEGWLVYTKQKIQLLFFDMLFLNQILFSCMHCGCRQMIKGETVTIKTLTASEERQPPND